MDIIDLNEYRRERAIKRAMADGYMRVAQALIDQHNARGGISTPRTRAVLDRVRAITERSPVLQRFFMGEQDQVYNREDN